MSSTEKVEVIDLTQSFYYSTPINEPNRRRSSCYPEITEVIDLVDESFCDESNSVIALDNESTDAGSMREKEDKKLKKKEDKEVRPEKINDKPKERNSKKTATCSICWDVLGKKQIASTKCGHVYCLVCLEKSLRINRKCPTCRRCLKGTHAYHPLYLELS